MITELSNEELISKLSELQGNERKITLEVLLHLIEFDNRKLFLNLGYSSLFDYCTRKLRYSEGSAYRRITGARCFKEHPELKDLFLEGKVTLCTVATAAKSLKAKITPVQDIIGKSKREVEALIAKENPGIKPREIIKPVIVALKEMPLLATSTLQEERYSLKFSITKEVYKDFEEAKNRLSHALGKELSMESVLTKLLKHYLKKKERKSRIKKPHSRYVSASIKREVNKRDGSQCCFVAPDGTRCSEKAYLEFDHVKPFALGGETKANNLRLLCASHNKLLAEQVFGKTKIEAEIHRHR